MSEEQIWEALLQGGSWQVVTAGAMAFAIWVYRHRAEVAAIDTWKEVAAIVTGVAGAAIVPLQSGSDWRVVAAVAGLAAMAAIKVNSAPLPVPARRPKDDGGPPPSKPTTWPPGAAGSPPRIGMAAVVVMMGVALPSCTRRAQAITADRVAYAVDTAGGVLAEAERDEGLAEIAKASTRAEGVAAADAVRARYEPVWAAYNALESAHVTWVGIIQSGGKVTEGVVASVLRSWCTLSALLAELDHPLPAILPCEGDDAQLVEVGADGGDS
ncbi:MAG: hypothetical protein AAF715_28755 [Myxococcota bacterium]